MRALVALLLASLAGCASLQPMLASPGDLEDYRAFRVAAAQGTRLARAQRYLERHPTGAFAGEVRAAFEEEEPRYFEHAQESREGIRRYLVDLPAGPHAQAALAMLVALGSNMQDAELRDLARRARFEGAKLDSAAAQRKAVGEGILEALGVLLDDDIYGIPRTEAPRKLRTILLGRNAPTWGGVPLRHEEDYFFLLPTRPERESRLLTLEIAIVEEGGIFTGSRLEGNDLIVRWAEADQIVRLDSSVEDDRTEARIYVMPRLEGALERRFPSASCKDLRQGTELYHRACNGWEGIVESGKKAGDKDAIILRAPRAKKATAVPQDTKKAGE